MTTVSKVGRGVSFPTSFRVGGEIPNYCNYQDGEWFYVKWRYDACRSHNIDLGEFEGTVGQSSRLFIGSAGRVGFFNAVPRPERLGLVMK